MTSFTGQHLLITGGTGSFGRAFTEHLLALAEPPARITIFSRDEQKQNEMAIDLPPGQFPIYYCLGDGRDLDRLTEVSRGVDVLVHSAAMKHVPAAEANPMECARTNIFGSYNVVQAARRNGIAKVVALSTDKAASPANAYGASKLLLERIFLQADETGDSRFSVVRYANVFGSKGAVVPLFLKRRASGVLPITNPQMTRFSITMADAIDLVLFAIRDGWGGEVILPVAPSYRLVDVATAIAPEAEQRIVGVRPGEKIHEQLFTDFDAPRTVHRDRYYVITPVDGRYNCSDYMAASGSTEVDRNHDYSSASNDQWLSVADLQALIENESIQL